MSFGGPVLKQHIVEFIVGTGVVTDGVTDANYGGASTTGPWTWVVPSGVAELVLDGCGGGGGGSGGWNTGTQRAGGGGGGAALGYRAMRLPVRPNASLVVTIGAAGTGGAVASAGTFGGTTTIGGLGIAPMAGHNSNTNSWNAGVLTLIQGGGAEAPTGTISGRGGGIGGLFKFGFLTGATAATNAASPPGGGSSPNDPSNILLAPNGMFAHATSGASGGAASTVGTTSGGVGGYPFRAVYSINENGDAFPGAGGQDGTNSFGGGGTGGATLFGQSGKGGGNASGTGQNAIAGSGFGFGGPGGGGSGTGANGGIGYVSFTYWSVD